ncbi:MAG: HEPN domain-containing protein [Phycisphaerae bacterium]
MDQARDGAGAERHESACFAAQQAAEIAVNAWHLRLGQEAWGHVVRRPLEALPAGVVVSDELPYAARVLDVHDRPTRHPNGHAAGAPGEHHGVLERAEATRRAGRIVDFYGLPRARP